MHDTYASPIHTATINGKEVRFYKSPDGRPDQPWHSVDDLQSAFGLNREARRFLTARMRGGEFKNDYRTIKTTDGLTVIAPHFVAQGAINAMQQLGQIPIGTFDAYAQASADAMQTLVHMADLQYGSPAWIAWMKQAFSRGQGGKDNRVLAFLNVMDKRGQVIHRDGETVIRMPAHEVEALLDDDPGSD